MSRKRDPNEKRPQRIKGRISKGEGTEKKRRDRD
jgi:hypothetical protein